MDIPPPNHIASYPDHRALYARLGIAGFSVLLNHTRRGPEYLDSTYPADWQEEYDSGHFYYKDPVLLWAMAVSGGDKRWSEVPIPDLGGVMKKARRHGLIFGAAFTRTLNKTKSLISVARDDRELTDAEMADLSTSVTALVQDTTFDKNPTPKELEVLQCLANDLSLEGAAQHLCLSNSAVKARLASVRKRTGLETNTGVLGLAFRQKLIL